MNWVNGREGYSCQRVDCGMQERPFDIVYFRHSDVFLRAQELEDISFPDYREASAELQHKSMALQSPILHLAPHFYIARLLLAHQGGFADLASVSM